MSFNVKVKGKSPSIGVAIWSIRHYKAYLKGMPRLSTNTREALRQIVAMQRVLYSAILEPSTKLCEKSSLSRAWTDLEDRKRILKGKPLPGSLVHEKQSSHRKRKLSSPLLVMPDMPDMPDTSSISDNSVNAEKQSQG